MTLPASYETREAAPEALREHLTEREGKFFIEVEGMKASVDFDTYSEAVKKRLADVTVELKAVRDHGLKKADIEEIITKAAGGIKKPDQDDAKTQHEADMERELASMKETLTTLRTENDAERAGRIATAVRSDLMTAATKAAPKPECMSTVVKLLAGEFEQTEGGETRSRTGCEFGSNLPPDEVMAKIKIDPRFPFWPPSRGGGAGGGDGGEGDGGDGDEDANPWERRAWNRTQQTKIMAKDMKKAGVLAKAAGSEIGATRPPKEK